MTPTHPGRWLVEYSELPPRRVAYRIDWATFDGRRELSILGEEAPDGSLVPHTEGFVREFTELLEGMGWGRWVGPITSEAA
jgi:hypothetical protein